MAEINVTDVMLGDWVLYEHKNNRGVTVSTHCLKVENITNDSLCMRSGDYWRVQKTGLGMIKPIPLTAEILEKNGFTCDAYGMNDSDELVVSVEYGVFQRNTDDGFKMLSDGKAIKYVHELQHALRLCGVEKEIIL